MSHVVEINETKRKSGLTFNQRNFKRTFSKDFLKTQWKRADPNRYWRVQHNLPSNDEDHGPLAHLPDYSYLNGEPSRLSAQQRKNYEFNASIVRRVHELDHELNQAKKMYADKIASTMSEYQRSVAIAEQIRTPSRSKKATEQATTNIRGKPSISNPNEYSHQPHLLNALRNAESYNEAFEEVVDPVGAIVPNKLMEIERPPYKRTGDRRRYQKIFRLRTPTLRMFPR